MSCVERPVSPLPSGFASDHIRKGYPQSSEHLKIPRSCSAAINVVKSSPIAMPVQYTSYILSASPSQQLVLERSNSPQLLSYLSSSPLCFEELTAFNGKLQSNAHQAVEDTMKVSEKLKKRVYFADSVGLSLTSICEFTEHTEDPPIVYTRLLNVINATRESTQTAAPCKKNLQLGFAQPAADYLEFNSRLENQKVCLENVVIRDGTSITGTVKVLNLDFEKTVRIRYSTNEWQSHTDCIAKYVPNCSLHSKYDTFSFDLGEPLEESEKELQFAVCFQSKDEEFWDNNNQKNYSIVNPNSHHSDQKPPSIYEYKHEPNWTTFSSWNDLITCGPYW